jgi:hypothetical protein
VLQAASASERLFSNEIRICKTHVSVTQRTTDKALSAKSHFNVMILKKSVLNDQTFALYLNIGSSNTNMFNEY